MPRLMVIATATFPFALLDHLQLSHSSEVNISFNFSLFPTKLCKIRKELAYFVSPGLILSLFVMFFLIIAKVLIFLLRPINIHENMVGHACLDRIFQKKKKCRAQIAIHTHVYYAFPFVIGLVNSHYRTTRLPPLILLYPKSFFSSLHFILQ